MATSFIHQTMAGIIAQAAAAFQLERTVRSPQSASVVLGAETLVGTLHDTFSPVEQAAAYTWDGTIKV